MTPEQFDRYRKLDLTRVPVAGNDLRIWKLHYRVI